AVRHASDGTHPAHSAACRARPERGKHPAWVSHGGAGETAARRKPEVTELIYLDYAATTPVDPAVARAISDVLAAASDYGNAASITHAFGRRADARSEAARAQVAALIGAQT